MKDALRLLVFGRSDHSLICAGLAWLLTACVASSLPAASPSTEELAFFEAKVRPLLVKHCYECHAADAKQIKGGLLLDSRAGTLAGGDSGKVIKPGKPEASLLIESIRYSNSNLQMPPSYRLSKTEVEILEHWIEMGAPDPREGAVVSKSKGIDWEKGKQHWAFQPVTKPALPPVADTAWLRDDLDRFILSKQEAAGLKPVVDVERFPLIRRVTLDLTGLPPTTEEVGAFLRDPASDDAALAKVVDRLLQSPAFGERWGRHWLDVARYADSVGKTRNIPFPHAWRYRNYVIDALNADKPYNQFLREQIAGDLLPAKNPQEREAHLVATGFLALGSMDLNERDSEQFELDRIDDQLDTLGRATMGLTLGCARCHDHKFDPLAQRDYYALAGVFASTKTLSGQQNRQSGNKEYVQPSLLARLDAPLPSKKSSADRASAQAIARLEERLQQIQQAVRKNEIPKARRKETRLEMASIQEQLAKLEKATADVKKGKKNKSADEQVSYSGPLAMGVTEAKPVDLALRVRGEPDIKGDIIARAFPVIFQPTSLARMPADGSGRLELAKWLTSGTHPLTARVMVNRIWSHLLGRGLVETLDNFGASGAAPTHPELLDHLSDRFVDGGWSIKSLVRAIVLSRTYRLKVDYVDANVAIDEDNRLYWRSNLRRLEVEAIRDSLLVAGGLLESKRPEGAPFDLSDSIDLSKVKKKSRKNVADPAIEQPIRSVYLPIFRSRLPSMFTVFDFAEPDQVNGHRDVTTVAPQSLFMLNNPFVVEVAERAAERILEQSLPDDSARVKYAYAYALCRYPTEAEVNRALVFVNAGEDRHASWAAFTQALFSSAEFRYIP